MTITAMLTALASGASIIISDALSSNNYIVAWIVGAMSALSGLSGPAVACCFVYIHGGYDEDGDAGAIMARVVCKGFTAGVGLFGLVAVILGLVVGLLGGLAYIVISWGMEDTTDPTRLAAIVLFGLLYCCCPCVCLCYCCNSCRDGIDTETGWDGDIRWEGVADRPYTPPQYPWTPLQCVRGWRRCCGKRCGLRCTHWANECIFGCPCVQPSLPWALRFGSVELTMAALRRTNDANAIWKGMSLLEHAIRGGNSK